MWRQRVETSERGWLTNKIALFGQFSELLPHPAPIICRALTHLQAPKATPRLLSQYHIPHLITCLSVRPKDLAHCIFVQCRPSPDQESACLPAEYVCGFWKGGTMGRPICQPVSVPKLMFIQQVREEEVRLRHETKQTRSRGRRATELGSPPKCGPAANCGATGPRSKAQSRGDVALIESEPLLLMQRRCRATNMNGVRARQEPLCSIAVQVTSLRRFCREAGSRAQTCSMFLAGLPSAPAKRHRTRLLRQGTRA